MDKVLILKNEDLDTSHKIEIIENDILLEDLDVENMVDEVVNLLIQENKIDLLYLDKLKRILSYHHLDEEEKIKLINLNKKFLTKNVILDLLELLPEPFYLTSPKSQLIIENTNYNREFTEILQYFGIAGNYRITDNNQIRIWLKNYTDDR